VRRRAAPLVALLLIVLSACGSAKDDERATVHVFAAASLTEAFEAMGASFEKEHPDIDIAFTFGASSALAAQIGDGAPADVFVAADEPTMTIVVDGGHAAAAPAIVARNRLAILVEPGNPKKVEGLADVAREDVVLVICAPEVPCGRLARAAMDNAGVAGEPKSLEANVKGVVAKVLLGEADAGIVYESDAIAAGDKADVVAIAGADDPALEAVYSIVITKQGAGSRAASSWARYVRSTAGLDALVVAGFRRP
jgi:molybdate transport system substrate-binding protein